jgi:hypothetical protein
MANNSTDGALLREFLGQVEELLEFAYEHRGEIMPIYLYDPLEAAWPEFRRRMAILQDQFISLTPVQVDGLAEHGLTGPELALKLAGFRAAYQAFNSAWHAETRREPEQTRKRQGWLRAIASSVSKVASKAIRKIGNFFRRNEEEIPQDEEEPKRSKWTRRLLKSFKWANIIIGSIPEHFFPMRGAVEEIKSVVERGVEDGNEFEFTEPEMSIFPGYREGQRQKPPNPTTPADA